MDKKFTPIFENEAEEEIRKAYEHLKKLLKVKKLPLFIYIFGGFPEYFFDFCRMFEKNLANERFSWLIKNLKRFFEESIKEAELKDFNDIALKTSIKFYKEELERLIEINLSLLILSIAQREAIKGRVFGLKALPSKFDDEKEKKGNLSFNFYNISWEEGEEESVMLVKRKNALVKKQDLSLILPFDEVLKRIAQKMEDFFKYEYNFLLRVYIEKILVEFTEFLPEKVQIDYIKLAERARKDTKYLELIHFLSDFLPTLLTHKVILLYAMKRFVD